MEQQGANDIGTRRVPEIAAIEHGGVGEAGNGREALWYPVGILLALLAGFALLVFCCSGRWIG